MGRRILIVDDQINTLKVLGAILQDEKYEILKAESAAKALGIIEGDKGIDVVLADLKLPGMDGLELYRKIRTVDRNIPFVIMTAHGSIQSAVEAMKEGVTNYLIKPLNYEELSIVLQRAIRERTYRGNWQACGRKPGSGIPLRTSSEQARRSWMSLRS